MTSELELMQKRTREHQMAAEQLFIVEFLRYVLRRNGMVLTGPDGSAAKREEMVIALKEYVEDAHERAKPWA